MKIWREEIFGPVLSVMTFKDVDEALRLANNTDYGLAAAIMSKVSDFCPFCHVPVSFTLLLIASLLRVVLILFVLLEPRHVSQGRSQSRGGHCVGELLPADLHSGSLGRLQAKRHRP